MAGDWIKMRGNLWDDPRVSALVDATDSSEAAIVGGLYWLWATADQHTEDGCMPGLTLRQIDRKTGIKGFGDALVSIGWLSDDPQGVVLKNFTEHNGTSAKRRCIDAQRKANVRGLSASDADTTQTDDGQKTPDLGAREEKRREEKSNTTEANASVSRGSKKCPPTFQLTTELMTWVSKDCPLVDVDLETQTFRDHTFTRSITDWPATWRNWMRKANGYAKERRPSRQQPISFKQADDEAGMRRWEEMTGRIHPDRQPSGHVIDITPIQQEIAR